MVQIKAMKDMEEATERRLKAVSTEKELSEKEKIDLRITNAKLRS